MNYVRRLNLSGAGIDADKLEKVAKLQFVQSLHLGHNPGIDDDGLKLLHTMPNLVELELQACRNITEDGVRSLAAITRLKRIRLDDRFEDSSAVAELRSLLPKCKVVFNNYGEIRWFGKPR